MANESFANTLLVEVGGSPLPADVASMLTYAYMDDSRNLPDMFVLRFRDPQHLVLSKAGLKVGAKVTLKVQTADPGGPQQLMAGEVTAVELDFDSTGTVTEVRGLDPAHRLFRGRRVAVYPNMTVADVVRKVATRAGLKAGKIDAVPGVGGQQHTQLSQDNVSDWEFLTRLADTVGAQINVIDGALDFRLPAPPAGAPDTNAKATVNPLVLEAHRNLTALRASVSAAEQVPSVEARGWDFTAKQEISATATPRIAGAEVAGADPVKLAKTFDSPPLLAADPGWYAPGTVKAVADALAGQLGGACVELEGVAKGNPKLRAGTAVALANVGEPFVGKYTLTSTRHLFSEHAGYTTAFTVSGRQERSLYGLTTGARRAPDTDSFGLVPGIVSDVKDPLKLGRVRLTFPWLGKDYTSGWARHVQVGAGKARGALVLPEVGDEVLAAFADPDTPYVLGGLHNGKDTLPKFSADPIDGNSGEIAVRGFVSRKGHKVELVETDGITIATGDDKLSVKMDSKNQVLTVTCGKLSMKMDGNGQTITVDAGTGTLELKGKTVKVTATGDASVEATSSLKLSGTGGAKLEGSTVSVTGQATSELTASGSVTVRGGIVRIN